jgi:hypothetical protein
MIRKKGLFDDRTGGGRGRKSPLEKGPPMRNAMDWIAVIQVFGEDTVDITSSSNEQHNYHPPPPPE